MASDPRILIVGAGVSGLLLAQALKKIDIACTVFEKDASADNTRAREWGMSIHWSLPLLHAMLPTNIVDRLRQVTVDPSFEPPEEFDIPMLDARTGTLLKALPLGRVDRVSRQKLKALLSEDVEIHYGKTFQGYQVSEAGVRVDFADGSSATGSAVVGADGARSLIRSALFEGDRGAAQTVPYSALNTHVKYEDAEVARSLRQWNPIFTMGVHPAGYWLWISVQDVANDDPASWVFQLQWSWKTQPSEAPPALSVLKERAKGFAEPFKSAWMSIPDGTPVYINSMAYWAPERWDCRDGRVILLGDAAHPMTFHRGQGLNHCIADVSHLTTGLLEWKIGQKKLEDVVLAYQTEMISRAGNEVRFSAKNTEMLHDWDTLMQSPLMQRSTAANH